MKQIHRLHENIFAEIAKLLMLSQLKRSIPKALKELEGNADLQSTLESMKYHVDAADKALKKICQDHPDYKGCKEKGKK